MNYLNQTLAVIVDIKSAMKSVTFQCHNEKCYNISKGTIYIRIKTIKHLEKIFNKIFKVQGENYKQKMKNIY